MILAVNIGNSNITMGGYEEDTLRFSAQLRSDASSSADEFAARMNSILHLYKVETAQIDGAILASVVPSLTARLREALRKLSHPRVLTVGPGLKSGLPIQIDNPAQLGGELLCGAVAAQQYCKPPFLTIHMDTAISMMAVNAAGALVGGVILPGPQLALDALVRRTAQLPQVELSGRSSQILATNTADCLQNGVILGCAAQLDGLIDRFRDALGPDLTVIATGNLPTAVRKCCRNEIDFRETLVLDGLYSIWVKNRK